MAYCCRLYVTSTSTTGWPHILSTKGWSERENSAAPRREEREDAAAPLRGNEPDTESLGRVDRLLCASECEKAVRGMWRVQRCVTRDESGRDAPLEARE